MNPDAGTRAQLRPGLADLALAVAIAAAILAQVTAGESPGPLAVNVCGGLLLALPLAWRRQFPALAVAVLVSTAFINEALGGGLFTFPGPGVEDVPPPVSSLVAGIVAFYSLGAYTDGRKAVIVAVAGVLGLWATVIVSDQIDLQSFLYSGGLVVATPWFAGRAARARSLRIAALEREQEQTMRLAVSDERTRIARELHDVVAHSVGVIVVQAYGARRVFDDDPDSARQALGSIEQTARTALADMRRSVGVLRDQSAETALEPQPGLSDLAGLVERGRAGGLDIQLMTEGEPQPLPDGVDLSAYRIVQEAMTNTIKHAGPVRATVTVRYGEDELELEFADDGPGRSSKSAQPPGSGHGIVGMRERASSHGGDLYAGPGSEGGFVVRASLPLAQ